MALHIIIDGYNLIRQSTQLSRLDRMDLQSGRDALIERLAAFKKIRPHRITVVFDGGNAPSFSQRRDRVRGIDVIYSRHGETADAVIHRMAADQREMALVVSSDHQVLDRAAGSGCGVISSPEFESRMDMAVMMGEIGPEAPSEDVSRRKPTTKKKGPGKRLKKRLRQNRRKLRKL